MSTFYAQPYNLDANDFYFDSYQTYTTQAESLKDFRPERIFVCACPDTTRLIFPLCFAVGEGHGWASHGTFGNREA